MNSITSITPNFGVNYMRGWLGAVFYDDHFISQGIAWFTRPDLLKPDETPVSHNLIVSGLDACIEALPSGVEESDLQKYFSDPHCHIFFRCPKGYDAAMADIIVAEVRKHIGEKYGYSLLVADALAGSIVGRILNKALFNLPHRLVSGWLDSKKQEICSELAARGFQAVPSLAVLGCLKQPARMITPRMLAFDSDVFLPMSPLLNSGNK